MARRRSALLLLAACCANSVSAQWMGVPAGTPGNGTMGNPFVLSDLKGTFDDGSGHLADYGAGEDRWYLLNPCEGDINSPDPDIRPCEVLLWFETFHTDDYDKVYIIDGAESFVDETGAEIDDVNCENERCLQFFSGDSVATTSYPAPSLMRSTQPRVLVHWKSQEFGFQFAGFKAWYTTDSPHDAQLSSLVVQTEDSAGVKSAATIVPAFDPDTLDYELDLPDGTAGLAAVAVAEDVPPWSPWAVTHPANRAGEILPEVSMRVNGVPYEAGVVVTLDNGLDPQPLVVNVLSMDGYSFWNYVIMCHPPTADLAPQDNTSLVEISLIPEAPITTVGGVNGWTDAPIYTTDVHVIEGDILSFAFTAGYGVRMMGDAGCPTPYDGDLLLQFADIDTASGAAELVMDTPGTYYFAGMSEIQCLNGQHIVVHVQPSLGLAPNEPRSAHHLTWKNGTSLSVGWDGYHEWFAFYAHKGEHVYTSIRHHYGAFYSQTDLYEALGPSGALGDEVSVVSELSLGSQVVNASAAGGGQFRMDWISPNSGFYFMMARTSVTTGARFGNYTVTFDSDWVDLCVTTGLYCGDFGTCVIIERTGVESGTYYPECLCTERWSGPNCEVEPNPPNTLVLSMASNIDGSITPVRFKLAVSAIADGIEPSMVAIAGFDQRLTAAVNLPGSVSDFAADTIVGLAGREQLMKAVAISIGSTYPDGDEVLVTRVQDYLTVKGLRKIPPLIADTAQIIITASLASLGPDGSDAFQAFVALFLSDLSTHVDVSAARMQLLSAAAADFVPVASCREHLTCAECLDPDKVPPTLPGGQECFWKEGGFPDEATGLGIGYSCEDSGWTDWKGYTGTQTALGAGSCPASIDANTGVSVRFLPRDPSTNDKTVSEGMYALTKGELVGSDAATLPVTLGGFIVTSVILVPLPNSTNATNATDGRRLQTIGDYWPDPDSVECYPYRCYDPDCLDTDIRDWTYPVATGIESCALAYIFMEPAYGGCGAALFTALGARTASGDPLPGTLSDYCPATCGTCTPYLGGPGVIVTFSVTSSNDISGIVEADTYFGVLANNINLAGSSIWGNETLTETEVSFDSKRFFTIADYVVTVSKNTPEEAATVSQALEHGMVLFDGEHFARAINASGGLATHTELLALTSVASDAAAAATLAEQLMRDSAWQAALAADGDTVQVPWWGFPYDVVDEVNGAIIDSAERPYETAQAQRDAQAAAEALVAAGEGKGANGLTTVERVAAEAEHAAAQVLGIDLGEGENIQDGFATYVSDVSPGGDGVPADFTQFGDYTQAAIAARASAEAARLVRFGADDIHPLDHLDPILSQAPSSQAFSDDPKLPSSTSRFSAQTDYWWIPDYLPGGRPPEQPDAIIITRYSDTEVDLDWVAPFDWNIPIRGYRIEMRWCDIYYSTQMASECDGPRSPYEPVFPTHWGTHTHHTVKLLQPGRMYFFHVRAYNIFDQDNHPNNYGVFSYDSLATTLWRVSDKMLPPVPHKIECHEPYAPRYNETQLYTNFDEGAAYRADAPRTTAKANCSIHLTWITPFSGSVENPLVDRSVDIHNNDIINYRIFYYAYPAAPPTYPFPDQYIDQNGTRWLEIPHPPDLKVCESDYTQPCPEGWDYQESVEYGMQVCVALDPTYNATGDCSSPQYFGDFNDPDKILWETMCAQFWTQQCEVLTEFTVYDLQDTTEYYFIINAVNMGGAGAMYAPYHAAVDPYKEFTFGYGGIYGSHSTYDNPGSAMGEPTPRCYGDYPCLAAVPGAVSEYPPETGAGYVWKKSAHRMYQGPSIMNRDGTVSVISSLRQFYGEGDFSDSSHVVLHMYDVGDRVLAQDVSIQLPPATVNDDRTEWSQMYGRYYTNHPSQVLYSNAAKYPGQPEVGVNGSLSYDGYTWYYPATIVERNEGDLWGTYHVRFDDLSPSGAVIEDLALSRKLIDTLGQGSHRPAAVTWRVPDAPEAPTFGTITEGAIEVHWKPPPFDGNTNHESQYADPMDTSSGGIVVGYRLFMQRYEDTTGMREEWIELDVAYLGTNTSHVVTNLDADVTYIFTVIAINIVGDSAHSQEAEAPITLEAPIPDGSVTITMRPICPEMQPRHANPAPYWLTCTNLPSTLLGTTTGGGTNAIFDYTLFQEFVEVRIIPPVHTTEEIWVMYPVENETVLQSLVHNGFNVTVFANGTGVQSVLEEIETLIVNGTEERTVMREKVMELGPGGTDCCVIAVPDGDYLLHLNTSNTRGWVESEEYITLKKCGCMDIFNAEFDASATHHAPFMCDSGTWEGAEKMVSDGEWIYYEQHLSDSVFAVEVAIIIESGDVDFYTSTKGPPQLRDNFWDTAYYGVTTVDHSIIMWEYRIPFNVLAFMPDSGIRGHQHPYIDVPKSLYLGVYGEEDFSRYTIRARNVKFQEERINLPDWEATNDMVETGRYKFYELYFSESGGDMDIKVSVQCKVGNITMFIAKKDKYPSEFRTYTQTVTTAQGGLAEAIDTWKPEEDRVVFIAVRGNLGDYAEGYPYTPTAVNEFIITARSYRYRAETARLQPIIGQRLDDSPFAGAELSRYSEVALDNFNFYEVRYSDKAYAIELEVAVNYGVVDIYTNFDVRPTQARYYSRAAGLFDNITIRVPFDAVTGGVGSVFLGVFGRETDYSNYHISVRELHFSDAENTPATLTNGTWLRDQGGAPADGYRFFRSYVGPEDIAMGHTQRSGPGSRAASLGSDPMTWGSDWTEQWVQTWSEDHRDEYDFDVFATVTVNVSWLTHTYRDTYGADWDGIWPDAINTTAAAEAGRRLQSNSSVNTSDPVWIAAQAAEAAEAAEAAALADRITPKGVSIYASLDWKYPTAERGRDAEVHAIGGAGAWTIATLTLPVWTYFGRTMHIGVVTEVPGAIYDIQVAYQVQFESDLTSPVPKPHEPCPSVAVILGNETHNVTMHVPCNGHGSCVDARCICETGFHGLDCSTVLFSELPRQPNIEILAPAMGDIVDRSPVPFAFAVSNRHVPNDAVVYLYVDGVPYPKERSNMLVDTSALKIYGLYRGRHTVQVVLTDIDGTALYTDVVHFVVSKPGGCANDCSKQGVCMDGQGGQYCICNDGFSGVDCSTNQTWQLDLLNPLGNIAGVPDGFKAGSGLVSDLTRQMDHAVENGLQQNNLEMEALNLAMTLNSESVLGKRDSVEEAMNMFKNQMESDMSTLNTEHEAMLDSLYRNRDRISTQSDEQAEHMRRVTTHALEQHHNRQRSLHNNQQRVQNKLDRMLRNHDIRFAMMNDEFNHANAKTQFEVDTLRHYDRHLVNVNDFAQVDCDQDSYGNFECYYNNFIKDCETGDLMQWRSGTEMSKYPVNCPLPPGPPALIRGESKQDGPSDLLREPSGRVKPVQRPFAYDDELGADLTSDARRAAGLDPLNEMTYRSDEPGWDEFGPSPTRPPQKIHPYGSIPGSETNW